MSNAPTHEAARRFEELDPRVKDMLRRMSPDEVETLTYVSTIPKDELRGLMKFIRDLRAIGWFARWLILGAIALFLLAVTVSENIMKFLGWIRGNGS
jgi:hypothetical protein